MLWEKQLVCFSCQVDASPQGSRVLETGAVSGYTGSGLIGSQKAGKVGSFLGARMKKLRPREVECPS